MKEEKIFLFRKTQYPQVQSGLDDGKCLRQRFDFAFSEFIASFFQYPLA